MNERDDLRHLKWRDKPIAELSDIRETSLFSSVHRTLTTGDPQNNSNTNENEHNKKHHSQTSQSLFRLNLKNTRVLINEHGNINQS
jgi:hypothetical protein